MVDKLSFKTAHALLAHAPTLGELEVYSAVLFLPVCGWSEVQSVILLALFVKRWKALGGKARTGAGVRP